MISYCVNQNTPEDLEVLRKEGFFPGEKHMEFRGVYIFVPGDIMPEDSFVIDWCVSERNGERGICVWFGNEKFPPKPEGKEGTVVGVVHKVDEG